ncbi:MAG: type IV pilus assembly protein PilM [Verrucomicrobia bacterium]|nr:type IV pilus assembly protein PilM [Verrucomicrobiota bacterium]MCH8526319.1 type IV pilus assembly protein PilM [Kiritimatiellia bacterium]
MSKRILTLDVGASTIKLAEFQISKDHQLTLMNYGTRAIGLDPQDEANRMVYTGSAVDELFKEMRIKPGHVLLSLSGQHVFSRYVKLPPVSGDKVSQIVEYEAKQNIPHLDEVVWDRQILPGSEGDMDVLLAAVKQDIVENLAEAVRACGLETEMVDISIAALYNAYRHTYPETDGCTMILDMGAKTTSVIFAEEERVWSRSFPVSGHTITQNIANDFKISFGEAEALKEQVSMVALGGAYEPLEDPQADQVSKCIRSSMTRLHAEIVRSINTYRSQQNGQAPQRILLTGGSSVMTYLDVFLQEKLNIEVEYFNPLQAIQIAPGVDGERMASDWHLLAEVVGLGLRKAGSTPIELNLLPPSIVRESLFRRKQGLLAASSFLLVVILALLFVHTYKDAANQREIRDYLQSQVDELNNWSRQMEGVQREIDQVETDLEVFATLVRERAQWARVLEDIRVHLPEGVWITQLRPDENEPSRRLVLIGSFFKDIVYDDLSRPDNAPILQFLEDLKTADSFSADTQFTLSVTDLVAGGGADMRRSIATFRIEIHLSEALSL